MEFLSKNKTLDQAILATLSYFDIFKIPLSKSEILENLLFLKSDEKTVEKELIEIKNENDLYSLNLKKADYEEKFERSKEYWKKVERFRFLFSLCPFIKLACVCNSLCINDTDENSDIDLLIVTEKNRIFLARVFITILTSIFGVRRHGLKIKKRFCLSFFVSESNFDFSKIALKPYDIYLAFWIKTLEPIAGDYKIYEKLISENSRFLSQYFENPITVKKDHFEKRNTIQNCTKKTLEKLFSAEFINSKCREIQLNRARSKMETLSNQSGTIINDEMLKFHDNDMREKIRNKWEERLSLIVESTL